MDVWFSDTRRQNILAKLKIVCSFSIKQVQDLWHHIEDLSLNSPSPPVSMLKFGTHSTYQVWKIYHSTLKLGEGGCFWPISWFWSVNLVVLPTILSSGVWGAIPTIFDIHSSNGLLSISGASSWLKNVLTKISKNFHVMTSFCAVIIFFGISPKLTINGHFDHHDMLDIQRCAFDNTNTFISIQDTCYMILVLLGKILEISNVMTSSDDVINSHFRSVFRYLALSTCPYVSLSFLTKGSTIAKKNVSC